MKKYLLIFILSVAGLGLASAQKPVQGIIATYDGSETSYKLDDMPIVKYETVGGVQHAMLYLKGQAEPVLNIALAVGKKFTVAYGEYSPTGINGVVLDKAVVTEKGGKKFVNGGKLIIIGKDGRMYNAAGVEINK